MDDPHVGRLVYGLSKYGAAAGGLVLSAKAWTLERLALPQVLSRLARHSDGQ